MKGAAALIMTLMSSLTLASEPDIEGDRFAIYLGALYLWDTEMDVSVVGSRTPLGATINFERDLNLEESVTSPRIGGYYRFNPHHRVDFSWYKIDQNGSRTIGRELSFDDRVYFAGAHVTSSINTEVGLLAYTWSFHHTDKVEIAASLGAYALRYEVELTERTRPIIAEESVTAPLPVVGIFVDYSVNNNWHVMFDFKTFSLELDSDTRGSVDEVQLSLEYRPLDNGVVGIGTNVLNVNLKLKDDDARWSVSGIYRGAQAYLGFRF